MTCYVSLCRQGTALYFKCQFLSDRVANSCPMLGCMRQPFDSSFFWGGGVILYRHECFKPFYAQWIFLLYRIDIYFMLHREIDRHNITLREQNAPNFSSWHPYATRTECGFHILHRLTCVCAFTYPLDSGV